jgi:hypothetical protein
MTTRNFSGGKPTLTGFAMKLDYPMAQASISKVSKQSRHTMAL